MMPAPRAPYAFRGYLLDPAERRLQRGSEPIPLGGKAFNLLVHLVEHAGQLVTRDELLRDVWEGINVDDAVITVNISALRRVLGDDRNGHSFIETVPRVGYRFIAPVERLEAPRAEVQHRPAVAPVAAAIAILIAAIAGIALWIRTIGRTAPPGVQRQITANPLDDPVARASISPDGRFVAYSDLKGIHIKEIATAAERFVPPPPGYCFR